MKAFTTSALFAASALAAPLATLPNPLSKRACPGPEATILLMNQDAHTSAQVTLCTDNLADDVNAVFAYTGIDSRDRHFYVTSAHLVSYTDGLPAFCSFQNNDNGDLYGRVIREAPNLNTWVTTGQPCLLDLGRSRIQCHVDREEYLKCLGIAGDPYTECVNKVTAELAAGGSTTSPPPSTCN